MATPARRAQAPRRAAPDQDAIAMLAADHAEVQQLLARYDELCASKADGDSRQSLIENVCALLTAHTMIEEEIFYPAARGALPHSELVDEAARDHADLKQLMAQLQDLPARDALFDAKVRALADAVQLHVKDEENELFTALRKSKLDLRALAAQMSVRLEDILEVKRSGSPA